MDTVVFGANAATSVTEELVVVELNEDEGVAEGLTLVSSPLTIQTPCPPL